MTDLRVGIVGCGLVAGAPVRQSRAILGNHAAACRSVSGARLVAAADPNHEHLAAFGTHWSVPGLYSTADAMFATEKLDIVIVSTPPDSHESICAAAIRAGARGLLCEKPFTGTAQGAERVVELCARSGVKLVANFSRRWDASHRALAERLAALDIGKVRVVFASYTGSIRGNGAHVVDTLYMLLPGPWRSLWVGTLPNTATDGPLEAVLGLGDDVRAYVAPVRDAGFFIFELQILAASGRARMMVQGNDIRIDTPRPHADFPGYMYLEESDALPKGTLPDSFSRALSELVRSITTGAEPDVPSSVYIASLRLLDHLVDVARGPQPAEPMRDEERRVAVRQ